MKKMYKKRWEDEVAEVTSPPGFPSFVGGDPSAGSPTDTLLRLNPLVEGRLEYAQWTQPHPPPTKMV